MEETLTNLVVGVGSPHGDDAIGFHIVQRLEELKIPGVCCVTAKEPLQILTNLEGPQRLWVVEASRGGKPAGTLTRFEWPMDLGEVQLASTHAVGLIDALRLAENLGRLPAHSVVYGVEIGNETLPITGLSTTMSRVVPTVADAIKWYI